MVSSRLGSFLRAAAARTRPSEGPTLRRHPGSSPRLGSSRRGSDRSCGRRRRARGDGALARAARRANSTSSRRAGTPRVEATRVAYARFRRAERAPCRPTNGRRRQPTGCRRLPAAWSQRCPRHQKPLRSGCGCTGRRGSYARAVDVWSTNCDGLRALRSQKSTHQRLGLAREPRARTRVVDRHALASRWRSTCMSSYFPREQDAPRPRIRDRAAARRA